MFRALICPPSGVCDYVVELLHWVLRSWFVVCWELGCDSASPDTTLAEPHPSSNTQQIKNETVNVVVQEHSRKLLKMGILMPETCRVSKKKNKSNK